MDYVKNFTSSNGTNIRTKNALKARSKARTDRITTRTGTSGFLGI